MTKMIICSVCGEIKKLEAKSMCKKCYMKVWKINNDCYKNYQKLYHKTYYKNHDGKDRISINSNDFKIMLSCRHQGIKREEFTGFLNNQKYCNLWTEKFKEKIRNRFHYKCFLCSNESNRKLSAHHVNYNKNCLCGSSCEFVPLCQSCHAKTNTNRQYWEDLIMGYLYPERYFMVDL